MKLDWFYAVKLVLITVLTLALHVMLEPGGGVTPQRYLSGPCTSAACARDFRAFKWCVSSAEVHF